jgi:hypothetical protein
MRWWVLEETDVENWKLQVESILEPCYAETAYLLVFKRALTLVW